MKKLVVLILALSMTLSLAACGGGDKPASTSSAPPSSTTAPDTTAKPDLKNPEYTPEQMAVAEKFSAMSDKFQALADTVNADESLLAVQELVDTMNIMIDAVNEDDALFADPANLTDEVLQNLEEDIAIGNNYVNEIEAMIQNYQGKTTITVAVEIVNDTGVDIYGLAMSPANDTEWGGDLLDAPLATGTSGTTQMTFTEDSLVWDLLAADSEGTELTFMGLDFTEVSTEGAKLVLSVTEGGEYMAAFAE